MAGVFLSYDRDDTNAARVIATALEKAGHSVWWDLHVRGGAQFSKVIEEALKAADAVVVLWSRQSVDSAWVRDEAAAGRDSGRLIPATIDGTQAPLGFRQFQTIDLADWKRGAKSRGYRELEQAVDELGGRVEASMPRETPEKERRIPRAWLVATPVAAAAAIGLYFLWPSSPSAVPTVAVIASDSSSKSLARDLLVNLGSLQSAKSGSLRLLADADGSARQADLVFEIAGDAASASPSANLLLKTGADSSVLWSKGFEQESGTLADLNQQMGFTAARVLGCALDARNSDGDSLPQQTLKVYLNACAQLSEIGGKDASPVIPALLHVTRDAPAFRGGWAKLLLAEAQALDPLRLGTADARMLRRHIGAAQKLDPAMPEIALAEVAELGLGSFPKAMDLLDRAKEAHPDDPNVLGTRSFYLMNAGRMREAVADAQQAVELDPLSPFVRNQYISTLAYAGRIEPARRELKMAERLWPGTVSLEDIRFRFNLRYGDPKVAEQLMARNGGPALDLYLRARLDPTEENIRRVTTYLPADRLHDRVALSNLTQAMGEFHHENELFNLLLHPEHKRDLLGLIGILFRPGLKKFREDPRFLQVMNLAGLPAYWRSTGHWPDFCFEPDLLYDCKKEAAKLSA